MTARTSATLLKSLGAVLVVLLAGAASFALLRMESWTAAPGSYRLDLSSQFRVDPALIHYRQVQEIPLQLGGVHAIAVGPDDRVYVAGTDEIRVLRSDAQVEAFPAAGTPSALAVGGAEHHTPGRLYVALKNRIEVFSPRYQAEAAWDHFSENALFTSLATTEDGLLVADAGNRVVLKLDRNGQVLSRISSELDDPDQPGFILPSPYFDVLASSDGLIHAVNPGARRIEVFSSGGKREKTWGQAGSEISQFFGCCNPSHLAQLPDGRMVTSEKGIPRVKIYSRTGQFECVVAGPEQLQVPPGALGDARGAADSYVYDIAVDSHGRILVLDPIREVVRVFVEKESNG